MYYTEIIEMPDYTSVQIQAMVRNMDTSIRKHSSLKNSNPQLYLGKSS
jgi:hypothetical protein